ncbi:G5 domain-containing protein [Psychrobacillus psychrodurans]|uniref:VanW family protein n=1 Tax=Psychrobacillus psychrodurans TaxID=126157 RepID=A0A9X3L7Y1_9BACI|nr:G5 domain-containing protein [Psychrobacillus psychrodurans]MCZ8533045.1 VanW family protein [Psychrobacillus psychrodurans]
MKILTKNFIIICFITLFTYVLLPNNNLTFLTVNAESKSSTIGGVEIGDLEKDEITNHLKKAIENWKRDSEIVIEGVGVHLPIDTTFFVFDVEASVNEYINITEKPWYAFWKSDSIVHIPLQLTLEPELITSIDENSQLNTEETINNIKRQVGMLTEEPIEAVLMDLSDLETERIAFSIEEVSINLVGLSEVTETLNDQVISTGEVFSFIDKTSEINNSFSDETADFIGSMFYSLILQTDFDIVERHSQGVIPSYLEPGVEADIDLPLNKDIKFVNNNSPALLKVSLKDSSLLIELYSLSNKTISKYEVRDSQVVKPRTIYRYSPDLKPGEESLIQEGTTGRRVSVYRVVSDKKGPFNKEEIISEDYYPPTHRIILKSSLASEATFTKDPDLEIDLNGDGLSDINENESTNFTKPETDSENTTLEDDLDSLPEGSYYDKAGNIISTK